MRRTLCVILLLSLAPDSALLAQAEAGRPQLDRSKPVPAKSEVINAWQKRQDAVKTLRFVWTEQQTHQRGWIPNPRFAERDRLTIPAMLVDRTYVVTKSLTIDGNKMRYAFEIDRNESPERRHYSYTGLFDGQTGTSRLSSRIGSSLPDIISRAMANPDAQNLDTRAILMAFRPLDPAMGHALIDRAVTNLVRIFYKGKSTMLLEERRDPSGWKMLVWLEPERDFLVSRYIVLFEPNIMVDIDIDYVEDRQWGWIPSAWRVTEKLSDGSKRLVSAAKVSSYSINAPVGSYEFQ